MSRAVEAIEQRGGFSLVLSGGNTPKSLFRLLATPEICRKIDWQKVHFYWGDERCVPPDHSASNFKMAQEALLSKISIQEDHIFRMKGELEPSSGATDYEKTLKNSPLLCEQPDSTKKLPTFDLVLLGLGIDGHTASLFPGTEVLAEKSRLVCAVPAPAADPAVPRLTLTLPVINNSRHVWFIIAGPQKGAIADTILAQNSSQEYPAAQIKPKGNLHWFVAV